MRPVIAQPFIDDTLSSRRRVVPETMAGAHRHLAFGPWRKMLALMAAVIAAHFVAAPKSRLTAAETEKPQQVTSVEGITEYRLDNGLRILLFPDASRPKVTVNLTMFVGSRHEGYGEAGMAHLLEHMLFKGTATHPDIPALMKARGASFNGTTWLDRTNYFETLPASDDNLEYAIRLEADRMVNSLIRAEDLATEFSVVRNEFERGENNPQAILGQRMVSAAYEWHNYGKRTIGNRADIERVPIYNLRAFYQKYYQPDNAMLIIAGRFEEPKALELVAKYFGPLARPKRELPSTYTEEPAQDGERSVILRRVGDVGLVGAVYHIPSAADTEFAAVQVLADILTSQPSGRLYRGLVETKKAATVSASAYALHDPGYLQVMASVNTKDQAVLEQLRDEMLTILESLGTGGVTQEEVDRARTQQLKERELDAADPNSLAIELSEWSAQGDWRLYFVYRDRLEQVTPEQVRAAAQKYLTTSNRTVGIFVPTSQPERTPIPSRPDIGELVENYRGREVRRGGEFFDTAPLAIESRIQRPEPLEGVKIALLPKSTLGEIVQLHLRLHFGNEDNLKGFVSAAEMLGPMLTRGTRQLTRQQLEDAWDKNFAQVSISTSPGTLTASVQTKRANLPEVLDLLRQVLREPSFPDNEFETLKLRRLNSLERNRSEPNFLASIRLEQLTSKYAPDDVRYTPSVDEEVDRLQKVTLDEVRQLHAEFLGAEHGELALVGDFNGDEVLPLLRPIVADWKAKRPYARIDRPFQPGIASVRESIRTPDKANAVYEASMLLKMNDQHPDYAALLVANNIFGGSGLSSRLADRLRQKEGLSYGAGSMFFAAVFDSRAEMLLNAIYNPDNLGKVLKGADEELDRFIRKGVTDEELAAAKDGYLKRRELARSNDATLARQIANQLYEGRTMEFEGQRDEQIRQLTTVQVNEAIRKHLDSKRLVVVTAGDFKGNDSK